MRWLRDTQTSVLPPGSVLPSEELEGTSSGCFKAFPSGSSFDVSLLLSLWVSGSGPDSEETWERGRGRFSVAGSGPGAFLTFTWASGGMEFDPDSDSSCCLASRSSAPASSLVGQGGERQQKGP